MAVKPFFRWYDLWIGLFIDTKGKAIYICPVPMFGVKLTWPERWETPTGEWLTCKQIEREGRIICSRCSRAVIEDEWLGPDNGCCLYCWEDDRSVIDDPRT